VHPENSPLFLPSLLMILGGLFLTPSNPLTFHAGK